jgi:hypothetical protein
MKKVLIAFDSNPEAGVDDHGRNLEKLEGSSRGRK